MRSRRRGHRRVREPAARRARGDRRRLLARDAPAPRRRGPRLLRRGRAPHRLQGDEGGAGARQVVASRRSAPTTSTSTCSTRTTRICAAAPATRFDWDLIGDARHGPDRPLRRADARQRGRGDRGDAPVRGRHGERHRGRARAQGPGQARGVLPRRRAGGRAGAPAMSPPAVERRFGPYGGRYVPETLVPGARRARGGLARGARRPRVRAGARRPAARLRRPAQPALPREGISERVGRDVWLKREDLQPHRRAQDQQRDRPGAAREADGQAARHRGDRRGPARRRRRDRVRAARPRAASSTWAPRTCAASARTSSGCGCWARRSCGVEAGARTLKEAVSEAIRDWVANSATTHYIIGSAVGPSPYPSLVRDLQRVIGDEARAQALEVTGTLPARVIGVRRRRVERDRHVHGVRGRRGRRARRRGGRPARGSTRAATARR